jgi:hypothetical protein
MEKDIMQNSLIMTLIDEDMEECTAIDSVTLPTGDGYGGIRYGWSDGAPFQASIIPNTSDVALVAEQQGVKTFYSVYTAKNVNLQPLSVFRRNRDGKVFRVRSDGDDLKTPSSAGLNLRMVTAEEWVLSDAAG